MSDTSMSTGLLGIPAARDKSGARIGGILPSIPCQYSKQPLAIRAHNAGHRGHPSNLLRHLAIRLIRIEKPGYQRRPQPWPAECPMETSTPARNEPFGVAPGQLANGLHDLPGCMLADEDGFRSATQSIATVMD
jgi:hypothetical protein